MHLWEFTSCELAESLNKRAWKKILILAGYCIIWLCPFHKKGFVDIWKLFFKFKLMHYSLNEGVTFDPSLSLYVILFRDSNSIKSSVKPPFGSIICHRNQSGCCYCQGCWSNSWGLFLYCYFFWGSDVVCVINGSNHSLI